jgi:hypothetical protein
MTIDRIDILLSRAVDGIATAEDWIEIEKIGANDPSVWRTLAEELRAQAALESAVEEQIAIADMVEIDTGAAHASHSFNRRMRTWSGWAAAAVVTLAWIGASGMLGASGFAGGQQAGLVSSMTADQALDQYREKGLREGRLMTEYPAIMLQSRVLDDSGRIEVYYMRRFIERAEINAMYVTPDDGQSVVPVPVSPFVPVRGQEFDPKRLF